MSTGMGFPAHASHHAPCIMCRQNQEQIHSHDLSAPVEQVTNESYDDECTSHEIWCLITDQEMHRTIRFRLCWKKTNRGRALYADLPEYGLRKGDRVEPSPTLLDSADFDHLSFDKGPVLVKFWRPTPGAERCYHRNPLLDPALGTGMHTFSIDELHCLHLGVFQSWASTVVWLLIGHNFFKIQATLQGDRVRLSLK
eukprot:6897377-Pyramimonas_sp.AAC.1